MTVWYTSDTHFQHEFVAGIRGFANAIQHDTAIIDNWQSVVKTGDTVYVLGDIASDERYTQVALNILDTLNGDKILIAGNHDPFHPSHRNFYTWQSEAMRRDSIKGVAPFARRKLLGEDVLLSHFPYERDRETPRSIQYRLRNEGRWLIHGHLHSTEVVHYEAPSYAFGGENWITPPVREIHVGLDAHNLSLVNQDEIISIIEQHKAEGK